MEMLLNFTFWRGNYVRSFWYGFAVQMRYKSHEHSGLAWGGILGKIIVEQLIMDLEVHIWTF